MHETMMTVTELSVIALSRHDSASSLKPQSHFSRHLFGQRTELALANPGLEALRRYAILHRLHGIVSIEIERDCLRDAGYDDLKIKMIDTILTSDFPKMSNPINSIENLNVARSLMKNTRRNNSLLIASLALLSFAFWHGVARAQIDPTRQIEKAKGEGKDQFIVGAGVAYAPAYLGADDYRWQPLPVIDISWGRFFLNARDGIGVNIIDTDMLTVGASLTATNGYQRKYAPEGIGKLSTGLGGRGFVTLRKAGFIATTGITKGISGGTKGLTVDASIAYPIRLSSRFMLTPVVGATWANRKHNNRYFGVTEQQSLASGLPQYRAGSGFSDLTAGLSANYRLTDHISLSVTGAVTTLLGDAKDSPIVFHKTQPLGLVSVTYRFGS